MPPGAASDLPFDFDWTGSADLAFSTHHTASFDYDLNHRQGAQNLSAKLKIAGSEIFVGGAAWEILSDEARLALYVERAEFELLRRDCRAATGVIYDFGHPFDLDGFGFGLVEASTAMILDQLATALQRRRPDRRASLASVGAHRWVAFDWAKRQGERIGAQRYCTALNEDGDVLGSLGTSSVKIEEIEEWLESIRDRPNFTAHVAVFDNLPPDSQNTSLMCVFQTNEKVVHSNSERKRPTKRPRCTIGFRHSVLLHTRNVDPIH